MTGDPRMHGFRQRSEVAAVRALLVDRIVPLPAETVAAATAAGRVLAAPVQSTVAVPAFDRAAMDGYGIIAEDSFGAGPYSPAELQVIGQARPGCPCGTELCRGEAVQVATGAPMPPGADAVLKVELSSRDGDTVRIHGAVTPGKHVGRQGEDVRPGATILESGRLLRPQDLGVIASIGVACVNVVRRPTVEILATGDELLPAGSPPEGHRIVDASSPMLRALAERDGAVPLGEEIVPDDRDAIAARIAASTADVLLITGGSSVGPEDHVPGIVRKLGELPVHGIAMRPSSPAGVGFIDGRPVFLLPGNPVSSLCAYEFFAGPTARALGGRSRDWPHRRHTLPLAEKITSEAGRVDYMRVIIEGDQVRPLMISGASILSSTTRADGVVIVPQDLEGLAAGESVTVHLYDE